MGLLEDRRKKAESKRDCVINRRLETEKKEDCENQKKVKASMDLIQKRLKDVELAKQKESERIRQEVIAKQQSVIETRQQLEKQQYKRMLKKEKACFIREQAAESQLRKDEFFHFMEKLTKSAGAFDKLMKLGLDFENPDPSQFNIDALMSALKSDSQPSPAKK